MYFRSLCLTGVLISLLTPGSTLAIPSKTAPPRGTAFGQLSSAVDQKPGGFVKFELQDSLTRMSATANSVTIEQEGTYLIIASPQVTVTKDGGCIDVWLVLNGQDVKNSGVRQCQTKVGNTDVVVSQTIMPLKKGDKVQVKTSGKDIKLDAITAKGQPLIPSIIFTIFGLY